MKYRIAAVFFLLVFCAAGVFAAEPPQAKKLKVYISVDMEGVVGAVTGDQLGPSGFEYVRFREFMTREALSAVNAAKEAGATEILVSDSHGNGENLLIELFPPDVRVIRSWPRHLSMMAGIDESFDAVIFIGYHASTANVSGVRAHTMSSATLTSVKLNGVEVPEGGMNAAIAGHFGVPIVAVSGDDAAVAEVRKFTGAIPGAEVKRAISFHSAATLTPKTAQDLIRARVKEGVQQRATAKAYVLRGPVTLEITRSDARLACVRRVSGTAANGAQPPEPVAAL